MSNDKYKNGKDFITFHVNNVLSQKETQDFLKEAFGNDKDILDHVTKRLDAHNKVMEALNKQLALGTNEGGPIIPGYMRIPTNNNYAPQQRPKVFPYLDSPAQPASTNPPQEMLSGFLPKKIG